MTEDRPPYFDVLDRLMADWIADNPPPSPSEDEDWWDAYRLSITGGES
jgi:hypothetical protein